MEMTELIERAGGVMALARIAGVHHSTVVFWRRKGHVATVDRAITISDRLGIPRHELRPDIWSPPETRRDNGALAATAAHSQETFARADARMRRAVGKPKG